MASMTTSFGTLFSLQSMLMAVMNSVFIVGASRVEPRPANHAGFVPERPRR
jgi:hypothetical protein